MSTKETSGEIQLKLREKLEKLGYIVRKSIQFSTSGWSDLEAFKWYKNMFFIEVKTDSDAPSQMQLFRHNQLRAAGFEVYVVTGLNQVNETVEDIVNKTILNP